MLGSSTDDLGYILDSSKEKKFCCPLLARVMALCKFPPFGPSLSA
jgi:hypothetical protein